MKKLIAVVLILSVVLTTAALADTLYVAAVYGDTNIRKGPGLGYSIIDTLYCGEAMYFAGSTAIDERGVIWFSVEWYGSVAWVSSAYTEILY